jgi:hypothetical protein
MAEPSETSRPREAPAAEAATRIAPRRRTADQRLRIQERLTMGLTVAHIARVEQLSIRRVRQPRCGLEENYGYFFPKIGLSVRFKILSIWIAALDERLYRTAS